MPARSRLRCDGVNTRVGLRCDGPVYRCRACGAAGCNQFERDTCARQAFAVAECLQCGATDLVIVLAPS